MIQEMKVIWGDDYTTGCLLKFTNARKYESEKLQIRTLITLFKWLYIFIEDNDLLKKYNTGIKSEYILKKYLMVYVSTIKNGDEVKDLHDKEIPKMDYNHTCLAVISLYYALKKGENYYLQVFLKCIHIEKKLLSILLRT